RAFRVADKVPGRLVETFRLVPEQAKGAVARGAQQRTNGPGCVVMVHHEPRPGRVCLPAADGATPLLGGPHTSVVVRRDPVFTAEACFPCCPGVPPGTVVCPRALGTRGGTAVPPLRETAEWFSVPACGALTGVGHAPYRISSGHP